ncbi:MAG TPA: glutamate--cysteine ligase [Candidatus Yaniella excrementigallinarum]|nr:glutamate--cysteine ligase [Candidatus Yaniella excrementigallinarum]
MRKFGIEEELLFVDRSSLEPLPAGGLAVALDREIASSGHELAREFKQEQLEIVSPPQHTLAEQLQAICTGRELAKAAASTLNGQVAAMSTAPGTGSPHRVTGQRNSAMAQRFGLTAAEQLTNGFHVHVAIESVEEGIIALDRIRIWLHLLLALSSNSPYWNGKETSFASYRYQVWSRWPTSGPTEIFGSAKNYAVQRQAQLNTQVPLDAGMLYFDARLSEHQPTLEVRVADICLKPEHAGVIAALIRALVETAIRKRKEEPLKVPATVLRTWSWQASRYGVDTELIQPRTGTLAPASAAIGQLLDEVEPVLSDYNETELVHKVVNDILLEGSGARTQRRAYEKNHSMYDVVAAVVANTHTDIS